MSSFMAMAQRRVPLFSYLSLRRWERETLEYATRGKKESWLNRAFSRMNPSQMGIIFVSLVLFGVDFFIAITQGVHGVIGMRKEMVAEAAQTKHETLQKRQMVMDHTRQNRDGKGFVLSDAVTKL